jgi:adenine-specific DNA methylase
MTAYPKRLIEVDLPIKRISAHARWEKSIRHGHISTLHIWWARRPLAACRAVICASLWPDPADENCPQAFRDAATRLITEFAKKVYNTSALHATASKESFGQWEGIVAARAKGIEFDPHDPAHLNKLRFALLDFIADFANWDNSTVREYLDTSRALTQAAHEALGGAPGTRPLVVDPFAGGGSIPLEALRVGADAFASDLNPVAVLLNKVVLEYIPKYGQRLADEVRKWGARIKQKAEEELTEFFPKDAEGGAPVAYLWARTIQCEGPSCGADLPLVLSLWVARKEARPVALELTPVRGARKVEVRIASGKRAREMSHQGTVRRGSVTCPSCGYTTPVSSVRHQLKGRLGGTKDSLMTCVVTTGKQGLGAEYRLPSRHDLDAVVRAGRELDRAAKSHKDPVCLIPDEPTPTGGGSGAGRAFSLRHYGINTFADLFNSRQLLVLCRVAALIRNAGTEAGKQHDQELGLATSACLSMALEKMADFSSSLCTWRNTRSCMRGTFVRQALPITWDFGEMNPFAGSAGDWDEACRYIGLVIDGIARSDMNSGQVQMTSAGDLALPDDSGDAFFTDPPYYDAVPYADLSDYFYVWHKRALLGFKQDQFEPIACPKADEAIVDPASTASNGRPKDSAFYEAAIRRAMRNGVRILKPNGVGIIVFAHKSTSGWEALLQGVIEAGWIVTASWPIDTERPGRLRAQESAALASSIHLVCRPRENADGSLRTGDVGEWRDVLQELPRRVHEWLPRLAHEGIVGADAIFACLGPALEIFSRYSRVERADGTPVSLREYLEQVWAAVAKEALSLLFKDVDAAGLEPDARLTAMWLWTLRTEADDKEVQEIENEDEKSGKSPTKGGFVLEFDAARKIAQGLGANLEELRTVVELKGQSARLLPVGERAVYLLGKPGPGIGPAPVRGSRKAKTGFLPGMEDVKKGKSQASDESGDGDEIGAFSTGTTTLDRIHQVMLLFARGRSDALKRFLVDDGIGKDARFWKLAQSLSALYPPGIDEKRWVDGVLARKKGLGL